MDEKYIAIVKAAVEAVAKDNTEAAFYYGKILSDQFYIGTGLKHLHGVLDYITTGEPAIVNGCPERCPSSQAAITREATLFPNALREPLNASATRGFLS